MFLDQFYSDITADFPILWFLCSLIFVYVYKKHQVWTLNIGIFLNIARISPVGIQNIITISICATFIWSTRLAFCDICLGCVAPFFVSKYRRIQFGEHVGRVEEFYFRHFCLSNDRNEKIYIPYHQYLTQGIRILDSISKSYTFPFP